MEQVTTRYVELSPSVELPDTEGPREMLVLKEGTVIARVQRGIRVCAFCYAKFLLDQYPEADEVATRVGWRKE